MNLCVTHIDTCLPCYLNDHYNRDGEVLIGIGVYGPSTTNAEVKDNLITEATLCEAIPGHFTEDAIIAAINEEFGGAADVDEPWDDMLELLDEGDEPPQAWFLFQWDLEHV